FPLHRFGLEWLHPDVSLAHPLADGSALELTGGVERTASRLGTDAPAYRRLMADLPARWDELAADILRAPLVSLPGHPVLLSRFGARAVWPASVLLRLFREEPARAMLAGIAAHVMAPLYSPGTGGVALMFALAAHARGWPIARGGSQSISDALAGYLRDLGGKITTDRRVRTLAELPTAQAYLLDVSPTALREIAGDRLPPGYLRRLGRYRYGPAAFKIDYALDGPVPWSNESCRAAGTVHIGPSYGEIGAALTDATRGRPPRPPFLITSQPTVLDGSRAPDGKHVFWAYAHVPHAWDGDLSAEIETQIERFAPGFRDLVLARSVHRPADIEAHNPNCVGGDIACGSFSGPQALLRPVATRVPYATPDPAVFLCSSATPPGPGVHGMCGYHAARVALRRRFGLPE
ncbi:MAG: phytoene desaturase family protein, partial [Sciscionella sp.]